MTVLHKRLFAYTEYAIYAAIPKRADTQFCVSPIIKVPPK